MQHVLISIREVLLAYRIERRRILLRRHLHRRSRSSLPTPMYLANRSTNAPDAGMSRYITRTLSSLRSRIDMASNFKLKDPSLLCETGWINGRPAKAVSGRAPFAVHDPATDEVWAHSESMDDKDTDIAVAAATAAFASWSTTPARKRARLLLEFDRLFREAKDDLKQIITMETGKALCEADGEIDYAATYSWLLAGECERIQGEMIKHGEDSNMRFILTRQPLGPVGLLTPWNFPVVIAMRKIASALAAGCTVVIKPSPETPISTSALGILCTRAGFPDGVVNVVTASHETTPLIGKAMCEDPRLKKISFTGSTPVGKLLNVQCASTLKKVTLELGGNGGWCVFDDADLEKAATALIGNKFRAAGQVCVSANRVFVQRSIIDKFAEMVKGKIEKLKFGHGLEPGVTNGPLTTKRGAARAAELVEDALSKGAKVVTGGKRFGTGYHFEPTLIIDASREARIYKEEMFAPILPLYGFDTEEEVIGLCNDTNFGLTNYVFTSNLSRAFRCSDKLQSGTVAINTANANSAESPFGGIKDSGIGKEGGIGYAVQDFCLNKSVAITLD